MNNVNSYDNKAGMSKQRTPISFDNSLPACLYWDKYLMVNILWYKQSPGEVSSCIAMHKVLASCVEVPLRIPVFVSGLGMNMMLLDIWFSLHGREYKNFGWQFFDLVPSETHKG